MEYYQLDALYDLVMGDNDLYFFPNLSRNVQASIFFC